MDKLYKSSDELNNYHDLDLLCNEILKRELRVPIWVTYEFLRRKQPEFCGFTAFYLKQFGHFKEKELPNLVFNLEVVVQLATNDMKRGATVAEIIFSCCQFMPTIEVIDKARV